MRGFRAVVGIGGGAERGVARWMAVFGFSEENVFRSSDTDRAPKAVGDGVLATLGEIGMGAIWATRGGVDGPGATVGDAGGGLWGAGRVGLGEGSTLEVTSGIVTLVATTVSTTGKRTDCTV